MTATTFERDTMRRRDEPQEPPGPRSSNEIPAEGEGFGVVPFVPVRCPLCGRSRSLRTYGQALPVRYHLCLRCRCRFKSLEVERGRVHGWTDE